LFAAGYAVQEVFRLNSARRADSGLSSSLSAAVAFYRDRRDLTVKLIDGLAADTTIRDGIQKRTWPVVVVTLSSHVTDQFQAAFIETSGAVHGTPPTPPAFLARRVITDASGIPLGTLVAGFSLDRGVAGRLSDREFRIGFLTGSSILTQDGLQAVSLPAVTGVDAFDARIGSRSVRMATRPLADADSASALVAVFPRSVLDSDIAGLRRSVAIAIAVVLVAILILSELLVRSFTGQLGAFSRRAQEVGSGTFAGELEVHGNDEFARFARVFNDMAHELEDRIHELEAERRRVSEAVARFGQALESSHDVPALLQIVTESAMGAVGARGGRVMIVDEQSGQLVEHRRIGTASGLGEAVLPPVVVVGEGVEGRALQVGHPTFENEPVPVLSVPLQTTQAVIGLLTLVDPSRGVFEEDDGATLHALASQGAVAIENARMHRLITKQASTDGLTGLANHREFQDQLRREVERAQRFALPLALILADVDDFRQINTRFGHLSGDAVLRAVSATLRSSVREIDVAARYGGEEFAIILPGTTAEGAARLAERIRVAIAERPAPSIGDRPVSVTASFGVAALPAHGTTQVELISAADRALYRAKDLGKNRVVLAENGHPHPGDGRP
jgi:diguanylate cyclase (GGDEF)-like protein